ncbi:MAG: energy-coupled thiamine transporter ThiT [Lachnospiraceae bacterium]|nr:energy-coupled thiamine transporter ThiT [Lachnospiraceae bacterium]
MKSVKKFAVSALFISVAFLLSFIKFIRLPFGGSITLFSMLFVALPGYFYGVRTGFMASFAYSLLHLTTDFYVIHPMQLMLDYIFAFTCLGITGFFRNKNNGLQIGYILGCILRFISSSLSGYIFFKEYAPETWNPLVYTVAYNGSYIFTECVLTIIVLNVGAVKSFIKEMKKKV